MLASILVYNMGRKINILFNFCAVFFFSWKWIGCARTMMNICLLFRDASRAHPEFLFTSGCPWLCPYHFLSPRLGSWGINWKAVTGHISSSAIWSHAGGEIPNSKYCADLQCRCPRKRRHITKIHTVAEKSTRPKGKCKDAKKGKVFLFLQSAAEW